jgi:paraquat-inducible protein B
LQFCCAVKEVGGFGNRTTTLEQYIESEVDRFVDNIDNDEYDDNEKQINKAITTVKKTLKSDDFWVELARAVLQKNLSNDINWVATINKKDQPVWLQAFQSTEELEFETDNFNGGRLVMYRHLV